MLNKASNSNSSSPISRPSETKHNPSTTNASTSSTASSSSSSSSSSFQNTNYPSQANPESSFKNLAGFYENIKNLDQAAVMAAAHHSAFTAPSTPAEFHHHHHHNGYLHQSLHGATSPSPQHQLLRQFEYRSNPFDHHPNHLAQVSIGFNSTISPTGLTNPPASSPTSLYYQNLHYQSASNPNYQIHQSNNSSLQLPITQEQESANVNYSSNLASNGPPSTSSSANSPSPSASSPRPSQQLLKPTCTTPTPNPPSSSVVAAALYHSAINAVDPFKSTSTPYTYTSPHIHHPMFSIPTVAYQQNSPHSLIQNASSEYFYAKEPKFYNNECINEYEKK